VREAVAALLHALGLEPNQAGSPLSQQLAAAKRALSEQVLPALKDAQQQQQRQGQGMHNEKTGDAAADGGALLDLAQFPLGFSTGGGHAFVAKAQAPMRSGCGMHACMQAFGSLKAWAASSSLCRFAL
jgi:hypothetical protein